MIRNSPQYFLPGLIEEKTFPYVGSTHLDVGCGRGLWTMLMGIRIPDAKFVGFDPARQRVETARRRSQVQNTRYVSDDVELSRSMQGWGIDKFESVSLFFTLHEAGISVFDQAISRIQNHGRCIVVDYDMKSVTLDEFCTLFSAEEEIKELETRGKKEMFDLHTRMGVDDCVNVAAQRGVRTMAANSYYRKYYVWIGVK